MTNGLLGQKKAKKWDVINGRSLRLNYKSLGLSTFFGELDHELSKGSVNHNAVKSKSSFTF